MARSRRKARIVHHDLNDLFEIFPDLERAPRPKRSFAQQMKEIGRRVAATRREFRRLVEQNTLRAARVRARHLRRG